MKKIITLIIATTLLASCTWNNDELIKEEPTTPKNEEKIVENETNTWEIVKENEAEDNKEVEKKEDTNNSEETKENTTNENTESNTEQELESEVNDLLDEFIDSLDEYDK